MQIQTCSPIVGRRITSLWLIEMHPENMNYLTLKVDNLISQVLDRDISLRGRRIVIYNLITFRAIKKMEERECE